MVESSPLSGVGKRVTGAACGVAYGGMACGGMASGILVALRSFTRIEMEGSSEGLVKPCPEDTVAPGLSIGVGAHSHSSTQ